MLPTHVLYVLVLLPLGASPCLQFLLITVATCKHPHDSVCFFRMSLPHATKVLPHEHTHSHFTPLPERWSDSFTTVIWPNVWPVILILFGIASSPQFWHRTYHSTVRTGQW